MSALKVTKAVREGVIKKLIVADMSVNGGGPGPPPVRNKKNLF